MRQVLFFLFLSFTFALAMPWSEPSKVSDVRRTGDPVDDDNVVPEDPAAPAETVPPVLDIGAASQWMPNYIMSTVEQPRGKYAPGAAEMSMGVNRYDETKGKMNVFSWTYNKYSKGIQPAKQDAMISPLSRTERPDQASLTFPPPICNKADDSSTETFASSQSVALSKTKEGKFNVGASVPLGGPVSASASYSRGWSDTVSTFQSFTDAGKTTMTKMEATAEVLHWRIIDVTNLNQAFVENVEDLAEWLPNSNLSSSAMVKWKTVCETSGQSTEKCAYIGYNSKLRGFVNTFGTDYINDATFGGKMTSYRGFSQSSSATEDKRTVDKKTESAWEAKVDVMPKVDFMKQEAEKVKAATATGQSYSPKDYGKWLGTTPKDVTDAAAKDGGAAAGATTTTTTTTKDGVTTTTTTAGRRLLSDISRRFGVNAGGSESESTSDTREANTQNSENTENTVMKFYGCTPQSDPITWCSSCALKPVAIRYQTIPLSTLISEVLKLDLLAKRVETYVEDEYQVACLGGWTWNKLNGECEKAERCEAGTSVTLGDSITEAVKADQIAVTENEQTVWQVDQIAVTAMCICDCMGTTHPDLARTFVLAVNGIIVTNLVDESGNRTSNLCVSDYAEYPQCRDGRVYNCRFKSDSDNTIDAIPSYTVDQNHGTSINDVFVPAVVVVPEVPARGEFYESVAIKAEECTETINGLQRTTLYNCQNPQCNIDRQCKAKTAILGKGVNQECGCPIEFTYAHCPTDNTWFSCGNPNCMETYNHTNLMNQSIEGTCQSDEIKAKEDCWCGEQSSEWKRCDSDQSWFLERKPAFRDYQSSNAMAKECNSKRMCASDNSLFENACDIRGFPCNTLRNETSSSNVENQNQVCFAAATGGLTAFTCTKCEPGTFSSGANSPQCEDCPAGKTSYDAGASACEDCSNGGSGYMCQDKVVPFDAQVLMRGSSQKNVIANPCGFRGGEPYAGCWDLDHGILKKQLKNGDNCDFTEVALPTGVAIKLYSFPKGGYWPTNGQLGGDKCCETDSIASEDSLETCTGDDAQQVQYRGTVQADNSIDGQDVRPSYFQNFEALDAAANARRLLGSANNEEMVCMYNIHLMEGYTCADKPGSA